MWSLHKLSCVCECVALQQIATVQDKKDLCNNKCVTILLYKQHTKCQLTIISLSIICYNASSFSLSWCYQAFELSESLLPDRGTPCLRAL